MNLGFLDYMRRMADAGHSLLFPNLKPAKGRASAAAAKWCSGWLGEIGLRYETTGRRIAGFHALRSMFIARRGRLRAGLGAAADRAHAGLRVGGRARVQRGTVGCP